MFGATSGEKERMERSVSTTKDGTEDKFHMSSFNYFPYLSAAGKHQ